MAKKSGLGKGLDSLIPVGLNIGKIEHKVIKEETKEEVREEVKEEASTRIPAKEATQKKDTASVKKATTRTSSKKAENQTQKKEKTEVKQAINEEADDKQAVKMIDINKIEPNRDQPRKQFKEEAIKELSESIKQFGVIQPLIVQKNKDYYEIIAGERRWRASKLAGLKELPVIIREYTPIEVMEISLIENIQREDLNPIEEANAYQRLIEEFHMKHEELASKVAKSRTAITNSMRLLKLDKRVQLMLIEEEISNGHARALLSLDSQELQYQTAERIVENKLSVRETEKLVKKLMNPKPVKEKDEEEARLTLIYKDLEDQLRKSLNTKVIINRKDENKGKIEIEYYSMEELERLMDIMKSKI